MTASLDTDPRTEGAPTRARPRTRVERVPADPTPLGATRPIEPLPLDDDPLLARPRPEPDVGGPVPPEPELFDQELVATPIGGLPPVLDPPIVVPDAPDFRADPVPTPATPTAAVPLVVRQATPDPEPLPEPPRERSRSVGFRRAPKPRVRRVRRVVRSIDTWTVFKLSVLFYLVLYAIVMVAGVLLWNLAYATGTIDNLERFFESFGWETFEFQGGEIYHSAWIAGLFMVALGTGMNVVLATVFNLMADLVGGVGVTVLEEEVRIVPDTDLGRRRSRRERRAHDEQL